MADKVKLQRIKRELRRMETQGRPGKTNLNLKLLALIILVIVAMVFATFFFRWEYGGLSDEYKDKVNENLVLRDERDSARTVARDKNEELNEILETLNISQARETALGERYINLTNLREQIETDLENTQTTLTMCQGQLISKASELSEALNDLEYYTDLYNRKAAELQNVRNQLAIVSNNLDTCEEKVDDVRGCLVSHNSTYCLNRYY